jgi:hypothetical protein
VLYLPHTVGKQGRNILSCYQELLIIVLWNMLNGEKLCKHILTMERKRFTHEILNVEYIGKKMLVDLTIFLTVPPRLHTSDEWMVRPF